ncbi:MAG: hypothetical protein KJ915_10665 [Candidatus Omnitrophica bacterium]|nr:hypothetical protein [Candidatus Omnitrophota bacterium]
MKKISAKKILKLFFEEEKPQDSKETSNETNEVKILHWLLIIAISIFTLFWIIYCFFAVFLKSPIYNSQSGINSKIERVDWSKGNVLKNGDFSEKLRHWVTSDGGQTFKDSKSKVSLEEDDVHSAPYSLRIRSLYPTNRLHYTKNMEQYIIGNPYDFKETEHWLGVEPSSKIEASCWYKGSVIDFTIIGLAQKGEWINLAKISGERTRIWKQLKIDIDIPEKVRAISVLFVINRAQGSPLPDVLIDDVAVSIVSSKEYI